MTPDTSATVHSRRPRSHAEATIAFTAALDRRVAALRTATLLTSFGRIAVIVIGCAWLAAMGRIAGLPLSREAFWIAAVATIVANCRPHWPGRLDAACELEGARPTLGERISRAVGILPSDVARPARPQEAGPGDDVTIRLRGLAAEEAAAALAETADTSLPTVRSGRRWAAAGASVVIGSLVAGMLLPSWKRAMVEAIVGGPSAAAIDRHATRTRPPLADDEASDAEFSPSVTRGLAVHRLLAEELSARFAAGPGLRRDEVPPGQREWLDQVASLERRVADDLLASLVSEPPPAPEIHAARPVESGALASFANEQSAVLAAVAPAIRENRLSTAVSLIESFLQAATARGLVAADGHLTARDALGPLASGERPPVDADELATARLARLVDPLLGDDSSPTTRGTGLTSSTTGREAEPIDGRVTTEVASPDDTGPSAADSAASTPDAGGGASSPDRGPSVSGQPDRTRRGGGVDAGAWVSTRDRRAPATVEGLAGGLPVSGAAAVDRYFSILAGDDVACDAPIAP